MNPDISSDPGRLRMDGIYTMLKKTYWCTGITKEEIALDIKNPALMVGA